MSILGELVFVDEIDASSYLHNYLTGYAKNRFHEDLGLCKLSYQTMSSGIGKVVTLRYQDQVAVVACVVRDVFNYSAAIALELSCQSVKTYHGKNAEELKEVAKGLLDSPADRDASSEIEELDIKDNEGVVLVSWKGNKPIALAVIVEHHKAGWLLIAKK